MWVTSVVVLLLAPLVVYYGIHLKRKAELVKVVSYTHLLTKCLEDYVQSQSAFPDDLQSLLGYGVAI